MYRKGITMDEALDQSLNRVREALNRSDELHEFETNKLREVIEIQSSKLAKAREALIHYANLSQPYCSMNLIAEQALKEIGE